MTNFSQMRIRALLCYGVLLTIAVTAWAAPPSLHYARKTVQGITLDVVTADLNDPSLLVTPLVPTDIAHQRKTFRDYLNEHHSLAQITGTFFDLETGESVGDIVVRGTQQVWSVGLGSALVVTPDNEPAILDHPPAETRWKGYESVLQGGVRLVKDGAVAVDPKGQGFNDRYMERKTARVAVGIRPGKKLVMLKSGHALLPDLAAAMIAMGCTDALALDGGGSTSLAYDGRCIVASGRRLANVLAIVQRPASETAVRIAAIKRRQDAERAARMTTPAASVAPPLPGWLLLTAVLGLAAVTLLIMRCHRSGNPLLPGGGRRGRATPRLRERPTSDA